MNFLLKISFAFTLLLGMSNCSDVIFSTGGEKEILTVSKAKDFTITGDGSAEEWSKTQWVEIPQRTFAGKNMETKAKLLYSEKGMYFLFRCEDNILTSTMDADFMDLWNEDVVEVFLWPDEDILPILNMNFLR